MLNMTFLEREYGFSKISPGVQTQTSTVLLSFGLAKSFSTPHVYHSAYELETEVETERGRPFVYPIFCLAAPISEKPFSRVRSCSATRGRRHQLQYEPLLGASSRKLIFPLKITFFSEFSAVNQWFMQFCIIITNFQAHLIDRSFNNERNVRKSIVKTDFSPLIGHLVLVSEARECRTANLFENSWTWYCTFPTVFQVEEAAIKNKMKQIFSHRTHPKVVQDFFCTCVTKNFPNQKVLKIMLMRMKNILLKLM